jgi:hypothetical protein
MQSPSRRRSDKQVTGGFCKRFGAAAVHRKYATVEQVKAAILEQLDDDLNGREHRRLGSILFDKGWITKAQIEAVLQEIRKEVG